MQFFVHVFSLAIFRKDWKTIFNKTMFKFIITLNKKLSIVILQYFKNIFCRKRENYAETDKKT